MLSWDFNLRTGIVCIGFPPAMLLPLKDLLTEFVSEPVSVSRSLRNLKATQCAYAAGAAAFKETP
jgi:hypothetical protein